MKTLQFQNLHKFFSQNFLPKFYHANLTNIGKNHQKCGMRQLRQRPGVLRRGTSHGTPAFVYAIKHNRPGLPPVFTQRVRLINERVFTRVYSERISYSSAYFSTLKTVTPTPVSPKVSVLLLIIAIFLYMTGPK